MAFELSGSTARKLGPALAGRDAELARLASELKAARESRSFRVVLVHGPAGVGRTALLAEASRRLADDSTRFLDVGASRSTPGPWAFARTLRDTLVGVVRPALAHGSLAALESRWAVLDGAGAAGGALDTALALSELALAAARDTSLVLSLDDVDAADPSSLGLIGAVLASLTAPVATRAPGDRLAGGLVVLSYRDDDVPSVLRELTDRVAATNLPLSPLDLDGVRAFLARAGAAERLFEASGGVPGRLTDLLQPGATIDFAQRRLERLLPADRDVLVALSVVARPVDAAAVAVISTRRDAENRLQKLAKAAFVTASPGVGRTLWSLTRDADRRSLVEGLGAPEKREWQRRVGAWATENGENALGFEQFLQAGDLDAASVAGLAATTSLLERHALAEARDIATRLAALRVPGRRHALRLSADIEEQLGNIRGALAALGRLKPGAAASETPALRARIAKLCVVLGASRQAERLARAALADDALAPAARWDARLALADARFLRGAYEEVLAMQVDGAPSNIALKLGNVRGKALLTLGRLDEARVAFDANAVAADVAGAPDEGARARLNVGVVAHRQGARREAAEAYRRVLATPATPFGPVAHANLSSLLLEEGAAEEALTHAHRALDAFARLGRAKEHAHAAQNLSRLYLYIGDIDRALDIAGHALELAKRVGDPYLEAGAALVSAEALLERTPADAMDALEAVVGQFAAVKASRYVRESLLGLAEAALLSGEHARAAAALDRARHAGALEVPALAAECHVLDAELSLAAGRTEDAADAADLARAALVEAPQLELPVQLYAVLATVADQRGNEALAVAERLKAARILDELAARVPPDARALFLSRRRRRAVLDAAGRALVSVPRPVRTSRVAESGRTPPLVGSSPSIVRVNALIDRIGPSQATVLVRGESGTGKELVAHALHDRSPRRALPIVAVNCGALNEELLLSELFGHEKGSFTGAIRERKGRFELADGGTIFLDEIGDISPRAQVALLRVLQERTFERVGGTRTLKVDVRVVCATNRNLEDLMSKGQFREDLYYRLRGATLQLPSLRARKGDLASICEHLLARQAADRGEKPRRLSARALAVLERHDWPGNVRELANLLESASLFASGDTLDLDAFELFPELVAAPVPPVVVAMPVAPPVDAPRQAEAVAAPLAPPPVVTAVGVPAASTDNYARMKSGDLSLKEIRRQLDVECIGAALVEGGGNISEAARLLKMKRSRLSQIVNGEPTLRALAKGGTDGDDAGETDSESDDEVGPGLAQRRLS